MSELYDYYSIKIDSNIQASWGQTIQNFRDCYPGLFDKTYFVNVPTIMGWVYTLAKPLLPKGLGKSQIVADGSKLSGLVGDWLVVGKLKARKRSSLMSLLLSTLHW